MAQIRLKNDNVMFFLPAIKLYLNFANPGPVEVDLNVIPDNEYNSIRLGILNGSLESNCQFPVRIRQEVMTNMRNVENVTEPTKIVEKKKESVIITPDTKLNELAQLLAKTSTEIRDKVQKMNDMRVLKELEQMEKRGKCRKAVLDVVRKKLDRHQKNVFKSVNKKEKAISFVEDQPKYKIDIEPNIKSVTFTMPE